MNARAGIVAIALFFGAFFSLIFAMAFVQRAQAGGMPALVAHRLWTVAEWVGGGIVVIVVVLIAFIVGLAVWMGRKGDEGTFQQ